MNMPRRPWKATQSGFESRLVADAAASGDRRIDPIATATCARGAFAARSPVAVRHPNTRPRTKRRFSNEKTPARPDPAPEGAKENP